MILAIDIGGTAAKLGLLDLNGSIHQRSEISVSFDNYQTPILDTVVRGAQAFLADCGAVIEGVGVSATGQIDTEIGTVVGTNGKIPHYEGSPIKGVMESCFRVPAWVLNDANAAVLGECYAGAGRGFRDVLMVTLGTGVGGGLILGGRIYGGARGLAGELGHFTLYQDGVPCACGKRGCYECYASTTALVKRAKAKDGRTLFAAVEAGNKALQRVLDAWLDDAAAGLTGLIHIFNPQLVLIGGGVSAQEELLLKPLRAKVLAGVMPRFAENLCVERASLGNDAGMIGALKYWIDREAEEKQGTLPSKGPA